MTQLTSPFAEVKFGWNLGESGWNLGMDENLLKFSFFIDGNIDGVVSSLPPEVNGRSYFNTQDNRVYYVVNSTYYSTPVPKWVMLTDRSTGSVYQFNGSTLDTIDSLASVANDLNLLQSQLGSAAYDDADTFVKVTDLANTADILKGAAQVHLFGGGTVQDLNDVVTASMKGAISGTDATFALQAMLDDPRPVKVVDGEYLVNVQTRLYPPSNCTIKFLNGAKLTALPSASAFYSVFDIENKTDITFLDPILVGERDSHVGTTGEQGFGIRCLSSKRIKVIGGDISNFWGDGLYFGATTIGTHTNCEDILISGVNSHHNRRQGLSLTGVIRAYVLYCKFNDTNGTNPQSGVDIEPNAGFQCWDIIFFVCEALRNAGAGFEMLDALNGGNVNNIRFWGCPARSNGSNGIRLVSARNVTHTGEISSNTSHGVYAIQGSNNLRLPEPNIHNNGGDGVQILTNTIGTFIGPGVIFANAGFGVQANYRSTLMAVEIYNNTFGGWYFGATSVRSQAIDCYVHDNGGTGGESAASSSQTAVVGGEYTANSTTTNAATHNLAIYGNNCRITNDVVVRVGTNTNKPAYGLRTTANSGLVCKGNDFRGGGVTGDIFQQTLTNADISDNFPYLRSGTTAQRPTQYLQVGMDYYDQTLSKPIWYIGGANPWRDAAGVAA